MKLRAGNSPDQYHTFTARLAANGYQTLTMRMVAGCILALGVPALLAGIAPRNVPWTGFRIAYEVIALVCIGLAVPWMRFRWPTRAESTAVVMVGSLALTIGCLVTIDPIAGMVIASAFAFILGFTALFHSAELLVFASLMTALTVVWLAVRVALDDVATALAVTTPITLLCVVVTFACRTVATVGATDEAVTEIEPITGLLTRDAFDNRAATLIGARHREEDRYFILAVIEIDNLSAISSLQGGRGSQQAQVGAGQAVRDTVRRDAVVAHSSDSEFLIADVFTGPDPSPLVERVLSAVASTPSGITASVGVVSTPMGPLSGCPPQEVIDEVIALAGAAMLQARRAGGNAARYVIDPPLGST